MNDTGRTKGEIRVRVSLAGDLAHLAGPGSAGDLFGEELRSCVLRMVGELGIPAGVALTTEKAAQADGTGSPLVAWVDDRRCRFPAPAHSLADEGPEQIARAVAYGIFQNPELLLPPSIAGAVQSAWGKGAELLPLLESLVRHGLSIEKARSLSTGEECGVAEEIRANFERIASEAVRLKMLFGSRLHQGILGSLGGWGMENVVAEATDQFRDRVFAELGVVLPPIEVELDEGLGESDYRLQINDLQSPPLAGPWVPYPVYTPDEVQVREFFSLVMRPLREYLRGRAGALVTLDLVEARMGLLRAGLPVLGDMAMRRLDRFTLTEVLRALVGEEVSIRDLYLIVEAMLGFGGPVTADQQRSIIFFPHAGLLIPTDPERADDPPPSILLADCVRMALHQQITHRTVQGSEELHAYLLDSAMEEEVRRIGREGATDEVQDEVVATIARTLRDEPHPQDRPVILTDFDVRRPLAELVRKELPAVYVVCYQELSPESSITPITHIPRP